jgi:hypothetical protein
MWGNMPTSGLGTSHTDHTTSFKQQNKRASCTSGEKRTADPIYPLLRFPSGAWFQSSQDAGSATKLMIN